jgi:hypothetical protein
MISTVNPLWRICPQVWISLYIKCIKDDGGVCRFQSLPLEGKVAFAKQMTDEVATKEH